MMIPGDTEDVPDACFQVGDEGGSLLIPQFAVLHNVCFASPDDLKGEEYTS